jgi:hypothetical protein
MEVSEGVELELWKGGNSKKASELRIDGKAGIHEMHGAR